MMVVLLVKLFSAAPPVSAPALKNQPCGAQRCADQPAASGLVHDSAQECAGLSPSPSSSSHEDMFQKQTIRCAEFVERILN